MNSSCLKISIANKSHKNKHLSVLMNAYQEQQKEIQVLKLAHNEKTQGYYFQYMLLKQNNFYNC